MGREDLEIASRHVKPVFGYSFFNMSHTEFSYYIVFEYEDPMKYYLAVMNNRDLYEEELDKLYNNMQDILDQEITKINNEVIRPRVVLVDIGFKESYDKPYILFRVASDIRLRPGRNIYENIYEAAVAEYNYVSYWSFPRGAVIEDVEMDGTWEKEDNSLIIYVRKGLRIRGYERIVFRI